MIGALAPVAVMRMSDSLSAGVREVPRHGGATDRLREPVACAAVRLVIKPADTLRLHVHGRELAHLAGAYHQDGAALQVPEDLSRKFDRRVTHRHGACRQAVSVRTRLPAANAEWKSLFSSGPVLPSCVATPKASFTCPRICGSPTTSESRPDATRNRWVAASVRFSRTDVRLQLLAGRRVEIRQKLLDGRAPSLGLVAARRKPRHDCRSTQPPPRAARRRSARRPTHVDTPGREVEPLSQLDRRGAMTDANQEQVHRLFVAGPRPTLLRLCPSTLLGAPLPRAARSARNYGSS